MKTYILSVNTLTWNLTSERHNNCAPCLGLILPIRWVTPPPNFLVWSVSLMALFLQYLRIWFVFKISTYLHDLLHYVDLIAFSYRNTSILSSTAFTYSYVFDCESFELSECDRTLISLCFLSQTLSVQIICILLKLSNVFSAFLSAEGTEINIKSVLNDSSLLFEILRSRNNHPTSLAGVGTWDNSEYVACLPHAPQMWTARGTCVIALCRTPPYK